MLQIETGNGASIRSIATRLSRSPPSLSREWLRQKEACAMAAWKQREHQWFAAPVSAQGRGSVHG
ncbi:TPA: hypothetical protein QEG05_002109 [Stenotrophomonas maltophilia]|nr:hypothetical protein [Stenotrophomonas maltophilia]HDS1232385.1 hypothetical protein [Stenotrophomonas maltophilia]